MYLPPVPISNKLSQLITIAPLHYINHVFLRTVFTTETCGFVFRKETFVVQMSANYTTDCTNITYHIIYHIGKVGNALLYRLPLKQTQRLQKVQNWATCLIDGAMKHSHATPLLIKLHLLPIAVRMEFKIQLFTH